MSDPQAVFFEAFDGLERLGPGSEASTLRALRCVKDVLEPQRILDIGCGAGGQTMVLARNTTADIVAVDTHAPYRTALMAKANAAGFGSRVRTADASMMELNEKLFGETFDVLWSESSIYVIGFDRGLNEWRGLLRDGGVLVVSEAVWLAESPSEDARTFWNEAYPAIRSLEANIEAAEHFGYAYIDPFVQPASDWLDSYYGPLEKRLARLRVKYAGDAVAGGVLDMIQAEIDLYRRAGHEYGYVFYLLRKTD